MSLPTPLTVQLRTSRGVRDVTRDVRDLSFRWTDPGGYHSAQVSLDRPLHLQPDEIAYYADLTVHDARSALVMWDGRQEDPGRSANGQGLIYALTAMGGQAHTKDRTVPYILVDQPLSSLERVDNFTVGGTDSVGTDPGNPGSQQQALVLQFPQGLSLPNLGRVVMRYLGLQRTGQQLARIDYTWDAGRTDSTFLVEAIARTDGFLSAGDPARSETWSTGGGGSSPRRIGTDWTAGRNTIEWRAIYTGTGGTASNDAHWASISNAVVLATRYNAAGQELLTAPSYANSYVLGSEVVADLLGRWLPQFDGANATISATTHQIDQMAYPDGVQPAGVLDDVLALEAAMTWRAWERAANRLYRFEFVALPTKVRYEADILDGYDSQASADGLYNQVSVQWRDSRGKPQVTVRTASVPDLDAAGLTRQGSIDIGSGIGSLAAAQRAGDQWLADRQYAPNAGRLKVARPILDLQDGRMVMPWEIRPALIRVKGINPRPDALNAVGRDGVTVFRIVASEFRASEAAATLELDSYATSTMQMIADTRHQLRRIRR